MKIYILFDEYINAVRFVDVFYSADEVLKYISENQCDGHKFKYETRELRADYPTKIVITGPAASGKDYLKNVFANKGFLAGVLDTTRPIRKGEKDGVDYYFKSEENFDKSDYLFLYSYNNWWYGLRKGEWKNKDVFVLTPEYINMLHDKNIHNFVVIYLKIPFWARLFRLLKRNDVDSVFRRMNADRKQFKGFNKQNILIRNLNF